MARKALQRLRKGIGIQRRVVHAIMIRELITRFGRENIGFLWMMVEPLLFAGLVALIWRYMRGPEEHGISIIAFTVTGYIPITLFRHLIARSVAIFQANSSLLYHRQVQVFDFIIARFLIEFLGAMMAFSFIMVVLIGFDQFPVPADFGLLIGGWLIYATFCFSLCVIVAPLSEMAEAIEKFIPVLTYIMIPISGSFTMVSWLTPGMREYILWSPFVHGLEMMRGGIWGTSLEVHYDIWYPLGCSIALTLVGLALCRHVRRELAVE